MLGDTGIDGTDLLPSPLAQPATGSAVLAMAIALMAEPTGTAWLVATGPLTNVALLFATFPEMVGHLKGLSIMGGVTGGGCYDTQGKYIGNVTRWAEFNIFVSGLD